MRRICWTIVYLVAVGLPIAGAAEPTRPAEEPQWKGVAPSVPRPKPSVGLFDPIRDFLTRWKGQYSVQRPAWPTLNPSASPVTVYPTAQPAPAVSVQRGK